MSLFFTLEVNSNKLPPGFYLNKNHTCLLCKRIDTLLRSQCLIRGWEKILCDRQLPLEHFESLTFPGSEFQSAGAIPANFALFTSHSANPNRIGANDCLFQNLLQNITSSRK